MGEYKRRLEAKVASGIAAPFKGARMMDQGIADVIAPMLTSTQAVLDQADKDMRVIIIAVPAIIHAGHDVNMHMTCTCDQEVAIYAMREMVKRYDALNARPVEGSA